MERCHNYVGQHTRPMISRPLLLTVETRNNPSVSDQARCIDEGMFSIHGVDLWVAIRRSDLNNPALLIVGGPGASGQHRNAKASVGKR